jgi:hypothetical protein
MIKNCEVWKNIKGYNGTYQVSNLGRIRSVWRRKGTNGFWAEYGYKRVVLRKNGTKVSIAIHRLVAEAFLDNPKKHPDVNHKDGDKTNNRVSNLEWCTHSHNMQHAARTGLLKPLYGEFHPEAKLTFSKVADIREKFKTGFYTKIELGKEYQVSATLIANIVNFKAWSTYLRPYQNDGTTD